MLNRYLAATVCCACALLLATAATSYLVDPFGLYQPSSIESLSRVAQYEHMRKVKPLQVAQLKPTAILIGSSRAGRIRVDHPEWGDQIAYNLSLPGITGYEQYELVRYAHQQRPLQDVIVALTFNAHLSGNPTMRDGFNPTLMRASGVMQYWELAKSYAATLLSVNALTTSMQAEQPVNPVAPAYLPDGSWHVRGTFFAGIAGFKLVIQNFLDRHYSPGSTPQVDLKQLEKLLEFCHSQTIRTHLVIMPTHVFHLEAYAAAGFLKTWQQWHVAVNTLNHSVAMRHNQPPFPLWAFGTAEGIVDETILPSAQAADSWFGDAVHFRPEFGRLMLDDVLLSDTTVPPVHGVRLDRDGTESYLHKSEIMRQGFVATHRDVSTLLLTNLGLN